MTTGIRDEATPLQIALRTQVAARNGSFPEIANLDDFVTVLRHASVSWDAIAALLFHLTTVRVSGERLRQWFKDVPDESVTP